jgi:hypothetical protein
MPVISGNGSPTSDIEEEDYFSSRTVRWTALSMQDLEVGPRGLEPRTDGSKDPEGPEE